MSTFRVAAFAMAGCVAGAVAAHAGELVTERFEISAPILPPYGPDTWNAEGPDYPATDEARRALAAKGHTFEELLPKCAPDYPAIRLPTADGAPLSSEDVATNYDAVAQCSYEKFTAKPYWIPQLVDDVDVCAAKVGGDWRMLAEADLEALNDADFEAFRSAVTGGRPGDWSGWGGHYFGGDVFVRANDGTLKRASLTPGTSPRVTDLGPAPNAGEDWRRHHDERGLGVRCIRRYVIQNM